MGPQDREGTAELDRDPVLAGRSLPGEGVRGIPGAGVIRGPGSDRGDVGGEDDAKIGEDVGEGGDGKAAGAARQGFPGCGRG